MKISMGQLRKVIAEALEQDLRGNLDPRPGHMAVVGTHDPVKDYLLWAKTNGYRPDETSVVASYALERGLDAKGLEVQSISRSLKLGYDAATDIQREILQQAKEG